MLVGVGWTVGRGAVWHAASKRVASVTVLINERVLFIFNPLRLFECRGEDTTSERLFLSSDGRLCVQIGRVQGSNRGTWHNRFQYQRFLLMRPT